MATEETSTIKLFYCYARQDKRLRDELEKHLEPLRRSGQITTWHDREIQPGIEWEQEIDKHLKTSEVILLLVSPDFMKSDYCYGREMQQAMKRHRAGESRVIPILLRPVDWSGTPIQELQALPSDAKPITTWRLRDEAFQDVAEGIRQVVATLSGRSVKQMRRPNRHFVFKSKRQLVWAGIASLLVMLITLFIIWNSGFIWKSASVKSTPKTTLATFCDALQRGDYQRAYDQNSKAVQASYQTVGGLGAMAYYWTTNGGHGRVIACTVNGTENDGLSEHNTITWTYADGLVMTYQYSLIKEDNVWRINGIGPGMVS